MVNRADGLNSGAYTDLRGLDALKNSASKPDAKAIDKVAREFESMYISMMLSTMREADQAFADDDMFSSQETRFYQDMLDKQMSVTLAQGRGIGLADVIARQLSGRSGAEGGVAPLRSQGLPLHPEEGAGKSLPLVPDSVALPLNGDTKVPLQSLDLPSRSNTVPVSAPASSGVTGSPESSGGAAIDKTNRQSASLDGTPEGFVKAMLPHATEAAARIGVDPKVLIAQAALETGWGKSLKGNSMNLFGIKADASWQGASLRLPTLEFKDGALQQEKANFRAYQSASESFHDYVSFLQSNPRYRQALNSVSEPKAFVSALQKAGYATDPHYEKKLARILNSNLLAGVADPKG